MVPCPLCDRHILHTSGIVLAVHFSASQACYASHGLASYVYVYMLVCVHQRMTHVSTLQGKVAKWWLPDDVVFVEEMPRTATGKLSKLHLREQFRDHALFPMEIEL